MVMDRERLHHYTQTLIFFALLVLTYFLLKPFFTYIVLTFILAYLFHPAYKVFLKLFRFPSLTSIVMILLVFLTILLPTLFLAAELLRQTATAYEAIYQLAVAHGGPLLDEVVLFVNDALSITGLTVESLVQSSAANIRAFFITNTALLVSEIANFFLGVFLVFLLLYFAFRDGESWIESFRDSTPLRREHKALLFDRVGSVTHAVIRGQFVAALIQGVLGGILLFACGVPNAVFWGVVMVILGFVPFLGTAFVWAPAGILKLLGEEYVAGIVILVVGVVVIMNIDNLVRPKLIGDRAKLSTPLVMLGVLGGLKLFGFIGLILGPLVLALLLTVVEFYRETPEKKPAQNKA